MSEDFFENCFPVLAEIIRLISAGTTFISSSGSALLLHFLKIRRVSCESPLLLVPSRHPTNPFFE